jgi:hypothetical protein
VAQNDARDKTEDMAKRRPLLLSGPLLGLYGASAGAILLSHYRQRYGSETWFPVAVGGVAALAIIPLKSLLERSLTNSNAWRIVFFFFMGLFPFAAFPFLGRKDLLLICGLSAMSAIFFYAAFGTRFQWPGFRPPPNPDACPNCGCEEIGEDDQTCPECGVSMGTSATADLNADSFESDVNSR